MPLRFLSLTLKAHPRESLPLLLLGFFFLRRRCKTRAPQMASPRNPRKSQRHSELEIREEKDSTFVEEDGKPRTRRQTTQNKKEKPNSVSPSTPSPSMHFYHFLPTPFGFSMFDHNFYYFWVVLFLESEEENGGDLDHVGQVVSDLIMWKDASKSTLSALSQLGILSLLQIVHLTSSNLHRLLENRCSKTCGGIFVI